MMKPKDLLDHLEKGDRTLFHLTKRRGISIYDTSAFSIFRNQLLAQQMSQPSQISQWAAQNQLYEVQIGTTTGGLIKW